MTETEPPAGRRTSFSRWRQAACDFADQVKAQRRQRPMTAWALAEQCQLSLRIVEDLEEGYPVEQRAIEVVCRNLDLPVPQLAGDPVHTLALVVRQRREQARLKQYQLATLAGIAAKTIKEIERGYHWPTPETCAALLSVTALQLQPQDIAEFVSDPAAAAARSAELRGSAEARVLASQEMAARVKAASAERSPPEERNPKNSAHPKRRLLFTFRVYADGSMAFIPSVDCKHQ